jgi:hypothetical protein
MTSAILLFDPGLCRLIEEIQSDHRNIDSGDHTQRYRPPWPLMSVTLPKGS